MHPGGTKRLFHAFKLTDQQAIELLTKLQTSRVGDLAKEYNISISTVHRLYKRLLEAEKPMGFLMANDITRQDALKIIVNIKRRMRTGQKRYEQIQAQEKKRQTAVRKEYLEQTQLRKEGEYYKRTRETVYNYVVTLLDSRSIIDIAKDIETSSSVITGLIHGQDIPEYILNKILDIVPPEIISLFQPEDTLDEKEDKRHDEYTDEYIAIQELEASDGWAYSDDDTYEFGEQIVHETKAARWFHRCHQARRIMCESALQRSVRMAVASRRYLWRNTRPLPKSKKDELEALTKAREQRAENNKRKQKERLENANAKAKAEREARARSRATSAAEYFAAVNETGPFSKHFINGREYSKEDWNIKMYPYIRDGELKEIEPTEEMSKAYSPRIHIFVSYVVDNGYIWRCSAFKQNAWHRNEAYVHTQIECKYNPKLHKDRIRT